MASTSNADTSKLRAQQNLSHQKIFFDTDKKNNKENIDPKSERLLSVEADSTVPPLVRTAKSKPDGMMFDRSFRNKNIQDFDTSSNLSIMSKMKDDSVANKNESRPLRKARFTVYDDTQKTGKKLDVGKPVLNKSFEKVTPKGLEKTGQLKGLSIRAENKLLPAQKSEQNEEKISQKQTNPPKPVKSPEISTSSQVNLAPIKEIHKNAKKTPKAVYDYLSIELAYNIDYMDEYVRFQVLINEKKRLSPSFLMKNVTVDQRRLVVKYLIKAAAVKIFDYYIDAKEVDLEELQCSALAALWIALKKDLTLDDVPEASDIMKLAGPLFQEKNKPLVEYEKKILTALNFEISFAEPFSMLALYTIMIEEVRNLDSVKVQQLYYCGSYLIDLSLLHDKMFNITAVHLAAISAEITLVLNMESEKKRNNAWTYWRQKLFKANPILEKYSLSDGKMNCLRNQLMRAVILSKDGETDYHVVYKKYNRSRYGPVSNLIVSRVNSHIVSKSSDLRDPLQPMIF